MPPICYLRFPCDGEPSFVAWKKGDAAKEVAFKLRELRPNQRLAKRHIFLFPKGETAEKIAAIAEKIGAIADYLTEFFPPELEEKMLDVCFDDEARATIESNKNAESKPATPLRPASKRRRRRK